MVSRFPVPQAHSKISTDTSRSACSQASSSSRSLFSNSGASIQVRSSRDVTTLRVPPAQLRRSIGLEDVVMSARSPTRNTNFAPATREASSRPDTWMSVVSPDRMMDIFPSQAPALRIFEGCSSVPSRCCVSDQVSPAGGPGASPLRSSQS